MNVGTSDPTLIAVKEPPLPDGILAPPYRAATVGMVALISLIAFEALAVTTAMPTVARDLDGRLADNILGGGEQVGADFIMRDNEQSDTHLSGPSSR